MFLKASCGTILAHHSIYFKLLMYYYTVLCHKFNIQFNSINDLSSAEKKPLQDKSSHATYLGVVPLGRSSFIQSYLATTSHQKPTNKKLQNFSAFGRFIITNPPIRKPCYYADLAITWFSASQFFLPQPVL